MKTAGLFSWIDAVDACPWSAIAGRPVAVGNMTAGTRRPTPFALYTDEERVRRDSSPWTLVQGVLAPVQFAIFAVSLLLVLRYVFTGSGLEAASWSVVVKTAALYAIMVTGAVWERDVFGRYLFAPAFFWEDAFSMIVIALHSLYVIALWRGTLAPHSLMLLALAAYVAYLINAAQFVLKFRMARRTGRCEALGHAA